MFKTGRMIGYGKSAGGTLARGFRSSNNHQENCYDNNTYAPSLLEIYYSLTTFEKCLVIILIIAYVIMPIIYICTV
jgi:hypothetical protein